MARRAGIKVLDKNYKVGDVVKVQAIIIHPMDTGFATKHGTSEVIPRFYVKEIEASFEGQPVAWISLDVSASANPKVVFPMKVTKAGTLTVKWINSKGEETVKTTSVKPK